MNIRHAIKNEQAPTDTIKKLPGKITQAIWTLDKQHTTQTSNMNIRQAIKYNNNTTLPYQ